MEYCDRGDLADYLNRMNLDDENSISQIGEQRIWRFFI